MGLFDVFKKKDCEICGKEVGLLGYKKLEDGEICKDCVKLLSPWFDDRRHSTVEQIKAQLAYREENQRKVATFRADRSYGESTKLKIQLENGVPAYFVAAKTGDHVGENADLLAFNQVTSFTIDVDDSYRELKRRNNEGEMVSYVPPRYEYSYNFYAVIHVNHPYFDDIRFRLNSNTITLETVGNNGRPMFGQSRPTFGQSLFGHNGFDPTLYPEYRQYRAMCDELEEMFRLGMQGMPVVGYAQQPGYGAAPAGYSAAPMAAQPISQPAPQPVQQPVPQAGPKFCPNCGAPADGGKFCQSCGGRL